MTDNDFVNAYVKVLNETLVEAVNKNLVMQAQLQVAQASTNRVAELEAKLNEVSNGHNDDSRVHALESQLVDLKNIQLDNQALLKQLDEAKLKVSHMETFKNELVSTRQQLKAVLVEKAALETRIVELEESSKTKKSKKAKSDIPEDTF